MRLWMGNIAPGTDDDELKAFVKKYAPELDCIAIQRVEGSGSRPGAILEFSGGKLGDIEKLSLRLNGMYWKERALVCTKLIT
jgi:hypothetical protein